MAKIYHLLTISAPVENVFEAISTVEGLKGWWTNLTTGSTEVGGELSFGFGKDYDMMVVKNSDNYSLVEWEVVKSTFADGHQWIGTRISFGLSSDKNKNTVLRFEHNGWKEITDFYGVCNYHWGLFMVSLKALCETGKGNPQIS